MPVADDVGDPLVVEERLEPPEFEEPVEHGAGDGLLVALAQEGLAGCQAIFGVASELVVEEPPGERHLIISIERPITGPLGSGGPLGQAVADGGAEPGDKALVRNRCAVHPPTSTVAAWVVASTSRALRAARTTVLRRVSAPIIWRSRAFAPRTSNGSIPITGIPSAAATSAGG